MSRRVEWPTAGITGPGRWVSVDRLSWQRCPDGLDDAARRAWYDSIPWRIAEIVDTPKEAVEAMRNGMNGALGTARELSKRKAGAK